MVFSFKQYVRTFFQAPSYEAVPPRVTAPVFAFDGHAVPAAALPAQASPATVTAANTTG